MKYTKKYYEKLQLKTLYKHLKLTHMEIRDGEHKLKYMDCLPLTLKDLYKQYEGIEDIIIQKERDQRE